MATNPKGTRAHLVLVPPAPPFTPYEITPTEPFWTCPAWCAGDCYGGNTYVFDGKLPGVTDCRLHEATVYETKAVDTVDAAYVQVRVFLERCDSDEDAAPFPADVVLKFTGEEGEPFGVRLTRAQRRDLAAALLKADDLDDTPDAPVLAVSA